MFPPPTVLAAVQHVAPGPLYYGAAPRGFVRVCVAHDPPVPLVPDAENPMLCGLGHPVDDDAGWAVMDPRSGKIVERPVKILGRRALLKLRKLRGEGGRYP